MNQYNEKGQEHGFWSMVESPSDWGSKMIREGYFVNGKKEGLWKRQLISNEGDVVEILHCQMVKDKIHGWFQLKEIATNYLGEVVLTITQEGNAQWGKKVGMWYEKYLGIVERKVYCKTLETDEIIEVDSDDGLILKASLDGRSYLNINYNKEGDVTKYEDIYGNWYDQDICAFDCPYNPIKNSFKMEIKRTIYRRRVSCATYVGEVFEFDL